MYVFVCIHIYIYEKYMYVYMYVYTHTHTHTAIFFLVTITLSVTFHRTLPVFHTFLHSRSFRASGSANDDDPFIVLTETKFSIRYIPVWARYSPLRTRVEAHAITLSP